MIKVVFFDFSGTIIKNSPMDFIAKHTDKSAERKMDLQLYKQGVILKREQGRRSYAYLEGLKLTEIDSIKKKFEFSPHIKECLHELKLRKITTVLVSNLARVLSQEICKDIYFDEIYGGETEVKNNVFTGKLLKEPQPKEDVVLQTLKKHQYQKSEAAAVGDSPEDATMFKHVGLGVLYKPDIHAQGKGYPEIQDFKELVALIDNYNKKGC